MKLCTRQLLLSQVYPPSSLHCTHQTANPGWARNLRASIAVHSISLQPLVWATCHPSNKRLKHFIKPLHMSAAHGRVDKAGVKAVGRQCVGVLGREPLISRVCMKSLTHERLPAPMCQGIVMTFVSNNGLLRRTKSPLTKPQPSMCPTTFGLPPVS